MFAILFINLFEGSAGFCDNIDAYPSYGVSKTDCALIEGSVWHTYDVNFDNILHALTSLFILSTLEGWPDYLYEIIDGGP
jgi:hypothetical protein